MERRALRQNTTSGSSKRWCCERTDHIGWRDCRWTGFCRNRRPGLQCWSGAIQPATSPSTSEVGFAVGDIVTIHSAALGGLGLAPLDSDGTIEHRRVVAVDAVNHRLTFDRPLMKPHATGDYLTKGVTLHASLFMGGPSVVYGVGERPTPVFPGPIDDLQMIHRYGWRGYLKFQMFRPEFLELHITSGSTD